MNIINFVTIWILIGVICSFYVNYQYGKILIKQPMLHVFNRNYLIVLVILAGAFFLFLWIAFKIYFFLTGKSLNLIVEEKYLSITEMLNLPLEQQAEHADVICKENVNNEEFTNSFLNDDKEDFSTINSTSIANLAFLILHSNNPLVVEKAKKYLENIKNFFHVLPE